MNDWKPPFEATCNDCGYEWECRAIEPKNVRCPFCKLQRQISLRSPEIAIEVVR